jgi:beta-galactosidase
LYQTTFPLELKGPDEPAVGVRISRAPEKANLYLNGHLVGRYWESVGPQKLFYLPPGFLNLKGRNHLAIAVWRWGNDSGLGTVNLEVYP